MNGQIVGYARVSTIEQNESRQLEAIGKVDRVFVEKYSGRSLKRPVLDEMLTYVRDGDTVRVKSPDRLARSTRDLLALVDRLKADGIALEFVDNPALNTASPTGEFMLTILAAVAQLELATIRERQAEGISLAKKRGVYDRAPKLSTEQIEHARARIAQDAPKAVVARELGVSRTTLYEALDGKGRYASLSAAPTT